MAKIKFSLGKTGVVSKGMGMGTALAMIISWSANKSILWCILHGLFSWFYVIYWYFKYN